jgi:hypothetical protein
VATRLQDGRPGNWGSIHGGVQEIFCNSGLIRLPALWVAGVFPPGQSWRGVTPTNLHLVPMLRMLGSVRPLPHASSCGGTYLSTEATLKHPC